MIKLDLLRYIGENINRLLDIMEYTEEEDIPAILVMIDFEKAFDYLEWNCIDKALEVFNFGTSLRKWVKIFYNEITSTILNRGYTGKSFTPTRGVRQGCPLSPYLFIIAVEILGIQIRNNSKIEGIKMGDNEHKLSQFADDTTLILLARRESFREAMSTFRIFEAISGLKINYDKTEVLRIGALKGKAVQMCPEIVVKWTNDPVLSLGIKIHHDREQLIRLNYLPLKTKIENLIKTWGKRKLTLYGKAVVIKSFLISQLVYHLSVLPSPDKKYLDNINKIILNYLWDNKPHRIRREVIWAPKEHGGLKIPNMGTQDKALKLGWMERYKNSHSLPSNYLLDRKYKATSEIIWDCNLKKEDIKHIFKNKTGTFVHQVLHYWCEIHFHGVTCDKQNVENQIIWLNSNIRINNQPIFYVDWYKKGILYIKDLMNYDRRLLTYVEFREKYGIRCNVLKYLGLASAIQQFLNRSGGDPTIVGCYLVHESDKRDGVKLSKIASEKLVKIKSDISGISMQKWNVELGVPEDLQYWKDVYLMVYKSTFSVKLQYLQYRILHRILTTNSLLKKWNKVENDKCAFCHESSETITHVLYQCPEVFQFWDCVKQWCTDKSLDFDFNIEKCLLGGRNILFNTICLVAKQYIYFCKCVQTPLHFDNFIKRLEELQYVEYEIARKKDKVLVHLQNGNLY